MDACDRNLESSLVSYFRTLHALKPTIDDRLSTCHQLQRQLDNVTDQICICQR